MHLDHVEPKSLNHPRTFDHANLLLSAIDSDRSKGMAKSEVFRRALSEGSLFTLQISSTPLWADCRRFFHYASSGEIEPAFGLSADDATKAYYTISILNLNASDSGAQTTNAGWKNWSWKSTTCYTTRTCFAILPKLSCVTLKGVFGLFIVLYVIASVTLAKTPSPYDVLYAFSHRSFMTLEDQHTDRKSLRTITGKTADWDALARDCVCFANGAGGRLLIGIEDGEALPPSEQTVPGGIAGSAAQAHR
jgi:uncharacterized protein (TIGR02646 family)